MSDDAPKPAGSARKGRGATLNLQGRFERLGREAFDDGWQRADDDEAPRPKTIVTEERAKSIIARNDSPDIPFEQSINPYRGCEHGCVYCLDGDTSILMADGSVKPLAELRVGDEIYGTQKRGHYRYYVRTRVLAHWRSVKPAYRIRLADGTEVVASGDHRFLTERGWKYVAPDERPVQRPYLTVNNTLMGFGRIVGLAPPRDAAAYRRGYVSGMIRGDGHLGVYRYQRVGRRNGDQHRFRLALADGEALDRTAAFLAGFGIGTDRFLFQREMPTRRLLEAIRTSSAAAVAAITRLIGWLEGDDGDWERGFVAGLFDAEGSFSEGVMRIANTDPQIIRVLQRSLGRLGFDSVVEIQRPESLKPVHSVRIRGGLREHLRFMQTFDPCIGRKRSVEGAAVKSEARLEIVEIEPLGRLLELFDITTGTGDFIANGVVSHNCYARPTHAYLGLSPGLDFETKIFAKANAAELLRKELAAPGYRVSTISIGANTDPYQPAERELKITRGVIEVLAECEHPFGVVTKNALIERDIDLLAPLAAKNLARAFVSVTNLDNDLARRLEPRASAPERRLAAIRRLAEAGVPVGVMVAPIIPFLTDRFLEETLERAREAGATMAGYVLLRLPHEVAPLFRDWLAVHYPQKAEHVMSLVQQMRGGKDYDATFGRRQRGTGEFADLIATRFRLACQRLGYNAEREPLDATRFRPPRATPQLDLF